MTNKYVNAKKQNSKKGEIYLFGNIMSESTRMNDADTSAPSFKEELDKVKDVKELDIFINSGGGHVFEGVAIYNMLKRHPATITVHIEGLAGSIASVIAMAGDEIKMASNSLMMIHNAYGIFMGDYKDLKKAADTMEQINGSVRQAYLDHDLKISESELTRMMDKETWMNAKEAVRHGFADTETKAIQAAAGASKELLAQYENAPRRLLDKTNNNKPQERTNIEELFVTKQNQKQNQKQKQKTNINMAKLLTQIELKER